MADSVKMRLFELAREEKVRFERERRVLSFAEYLGLVEASPRIFARDAVLYVRDMIESFGHREIDTPAGPRTRHALFDQAFLAEGERAQASLIGQEEVVSEVLRAISNFARVGHANRVVLLYGPNGSAKSTTAACILRGLEEYSRKDEGAVYRYSWVFPKKKVVRGSIGFGGEKTDGEPGESFAHLKDDELEARILIEVRDHPLFLLPKDTRRALLADLLGPGATIPRYLAAGSLCDKSQKIFDALLASYDGNLADVLRHVRVERVFFSRRYRVGAVTLGPEVSVDARERQITMDQNLGALPISLQGLSLYEVSGELVDASGGMLELSDLLKRPLDAFRYLELTVETGEVALGSQTLQVNTVMLASANDVHLEAFKKHPEFPSFRGRLELIRVPYLLDHQREKELYDHQIGSRVAVHVAPHATEVAARFAVLSRLLPPDPARHEERDRPLVADLTAFRKLELYAGDWSSFGSSLSRARATELTERLQAEWSGAPVYEGGHGASPRTMRTILLDAAQHPDFDYLSPFAVLARIENVLERRDDFALQAPSPTPSGYHDLRRALVDLRAWLLDSIESELSEASGLVEAGSYEELLSRYIEHVSASLKGETVKNAQTGRNEAPDQGLFASVEGLLEVGREPGAPSPKGPEARARLLGRIAAWSLDHAGVRVRDSEIFTELLEALRRAVFQERSVGIAKFCAQLVHEDEARSTEERAAIAAAFRRLEAIGYTRKSAKDAAAHLLAERLDRSTTVPG